jgi:hypothetical protein
MPSPDIFVLIHKHCLRIQVRSQAFRDISLRYRAKYYRMAQVDTGLAAVESRTDPSPLSATSPANPGRRPECFNSTLQECLFVLTATMSIGMSSFLYGMTTVITAPIGRDLHMTSAQITWINASSAFVSLHRSRR